MGVQRPAEGGQGSEFGVQGRHRRGGKGARRGRWGEKGRRERPQGWARFFFWNLEPRGEGRMQRSEVRGSRTAGTASALGERSYRTAEQPHGRFGRGQKAEVGGQGEQNSRRSVCAQRAQLQNSRRATRTVWKRSESRGRRSGKAPKGWQGGEKGAEEGTGGVAGGRGRGDGAKRSLKHTGARPVDGVEGVLPETWNLKPGTEVNSHTDGHGRTRTGTDGWEEGRGQRSEVREGTEGVAGVFPETWKRGGFLFSLWGVGERVWWGDGDSSCTDEDCAAGWL